MSWTQLAEFSPTSSLVVPPRRVLDSLNSVSAGEATHHPVRVWLEVWVGQLLGETR